MLSRFTRIDRKEGPFTKHYQESMFAPTAAGRYSVEVLVDDGHLVPGPNRVYVVVHDSADTDVEGADVMLTYRPEEGPAGAVARITAQGWGLYIADNLVVPDSGPGELVVTVGASGVADTARFALGTEAASQTTAKPGSQQ